MRIVEQIYYDETYFGAPVDPADFPRYCARAEDLIASATFYRVAEDNLSALPEKVQTAYQKAVCAQIEYFTIVGIDAASAGVLDAGFTVGKVTVTGGGLPSGRTSMLCPASLTLLEQTGLMNPQVWTLGQPGDLPGGWY